MASKASLWGFQPASSDDEEEPNSDSGARRGGGSQEPRLPICLEQRSAALAHPPRVGLQAAPRPAGARSAAARSSQRSSGAG